MGFFNFFKKKKTELEINSNEVLNPKEEFKRKEEFRNSDNDIEVHEIAFSSLEYNKSNKNYTDYQNSLYKFGFDEEKFIMTTIGLVLNFYYNSEKKEAENLYNNLSKDFPTNEDVIWLFIEIICLMNLPNDKEFINKYMNLKRQKHDFNFQYEIEYQKGLELKNQKHYTESIGIFESLNKIHPFAWNYYQTAIIKNLIGEETEVYVNLKKAIALDSTIKEDAKKYFELNNLRDKLEFMQIVE